MPPPLIRRRGFSASAKGKEAKLCFMGQVLIETRHGLIPGGSGFSLNLNGPREGDNPPGNP
jgi:hypothetical protein